MRKIYYKMLFVSVLGVFFDSRIESEKNYKDDLKEGEGRVI